MERDIPRDHAFLRGSLLGVADDKLRRQPRRHPPAPLRANPGIDMPLRCVFIALDPAAGAEWKLLVHLTRRVVLFFAVTDQRHDLAGIECHERAIVAGAQGPGETREVRRFRVAIHFVGEVTTIDPPTVHLSAPAPRPLGEHGFPFHLKLFVTLAGPQVFAPTVRPGRLITPFPTEPFLRDRDSRRCTAACINHEPDVIPAQRCREVRHEITPGTLARLDADDLVIGGIRAAKVTGVLAEREKTVRRTEVAELGGERIDVERVHASVPVGGGDVRAGGRFAFNGHERDVHAPACLAKPIRWMRSDLSHDISLKVTMVSR